VTAATQEVAGSKPVKCQYTTIIIPDPEETEDDCLLTYWRMFSNGGFSDNVPFTNGITYEDFRKGNYFVVFDLSTSSKCNSSQLIPGNIKPY